MCAETAPSQFPKSLNTIVLAYSGGLDTTVIIPWLKENYGARVIAVCVDVGVEAGTAEELSALEKRARACGADEVIIEPVQDEFVADFIYPCLKAGAVYEGQYLLGTAMARPLIASVLVRYAKQYNADAICHGATGKGNDQVRFELSIKALAPDVAIIAPWRLWHIESREDAIAYLEARNLPVPSKPEESYSRDNNLWHLSHEGLELEDPANAPQYERLLQRSKSPFTASDTPAVIRLEFEQGLPKSLDGETLSPVKLLQKLNDIGGANGIGVLDMVENRVVGLKARGIYETPGGSILYKAHEMLEQLCLDRKTLSIKHKLAIEYAHLVYTGEWFTPSRQALDAFIDVTQQTVSGSVSLMLYKGNMIPQGMTSPYSLYDAELASFTTGALYQHQDAQGFITLTGLPMQVRARMMAKQAASDAASS